MLFAIIIAFVSLIILVTLHEFGHFVLARRFGVPVEEFGVGFPPRLFGKKIGETVYSLNLLPLGAFVKIYGEEGGIDDSLSFSQKPVWQRGLIILGGVIVFWLVAALLLSFVSAIWGLPTALSDEAAEGVREPKVQIIQVLPGSRAQEAGIMPLDTILGLRSETREIFTTKTGEVQTFIQENREGEIWLKVLRGSEEKEISVVPNEKGMIGVSLVRTGWKVVPWYLSLVEGTRSTFRLTYAVVKGLADILVKLISGQKVEGVEVRGPIGIGELFAQSYQVGLGYFLYFLSLISIYLAIFNILPIPAVDGGRLLFLGLEKIRGRALSPKIEQRVNAAFFILLVALLIIVTVRDVIRLF